MHVRVPTCYLAASFRAQSPRLSVSNGPLVVALDFHGVVLDTEPEMCRVAWRTGCRLWPHLTDECTVVERVMDESAYVDRRRLGGEPLCGTAEDAMPNWLRAKLRLLSPLVQRDDDALLLVRLCMEEVILSGPRKRPLTVGEIAANWAGGELKEMLHLRYDLSESEAQAACAETRTAWMSDEPAEWESAHAQYPAALADVREAAAPSLISKPSLYLFGRSAADATCVERLLARHSVRLPAAQILCAAGAREKADALAELRARHADATLRFVDDDADSLRAIAADARLFSVQPFFASWGYCTPQQESTVAAMPRVQALASSRDLERVLAMPRSDGTRMRVS